MNFTNPIARHTGPRYQEGSAQRSDRDADATQRLWAKNLSTAQQLARTVQCVEQLQRQLDRLRRRGGSSESVTGMIHRGEWSASTQYAVQNVVTRGILGDFVALELPTVAIPPESGVPWHSISVPAQGSWA